MKQMKKFALAAMMAALFSLPCSGAWAQAEHAHCMCGKASCDKHAQIEYEWITQNDGTVLEGDGFALKDYGIEGTLKFKSTQEGGTVYLCLNGKELSGNVEVDGNLVLCNCSEEWPGTIRYKSENGSHSGVQVNGDFTMYGGSISGHQKRGNGGGVYADGDVTMYDGLIFGGTATSGGNGGGVYAGGSMTMYGGTIKTCITYSNGGGVYTVGSMTMHGGTIGETNVAFGNRAGQNGGGVYAEKGVTITGGSILKGVATNGNGGGVYAEKGDVVISGDATIEGNQAPEGNGGGVYQGQGNNSLTISGGAVIKNNKAPKGNGGGVYAAGNTTITGAEIEENSAKNGGGVYTKGGDKTLTISGSTINDNRATSYDATGNGGGVYAEGSVNIAGSTIKENTTYGNGGGVYAGGNTTITDAVISDNDSENGGGVYTKGGDKTLTISGGTEISGNDVNGGGGGVYAEGSMALTGGTISSNKAGNGGGVYAKGSMTLTGGTISGNTAKYGGSGGGVYWKGGDKTLKASGSVKISGNTADGAENNLYLPSKTKIDVEGLTGSIGVTTKNVPTVGSPVVFANGKSGTDMDKSAEAMFSDNAAYVVGREGEKSAALYVAAPYTAPTAKEGLVYSGSEQALVTAGSDNLLYALGTDEKTAPTGGWNAAIPAGLDAGKYYVWYYAPSGGGYFATKPQCVEVSIAKATPVVTDVACDQTIYEDTDVGTLVLTYTVSPSMSGAMTIAQGKLTVGENACDWTFTPADTTNYETVSGKVTLAVLEAEKPDDEDPKDEDPKDEETGDPSQEEADVDLPDTGDASNPALYVALMALCAAGYALMRRSRRAE